MIKDMKYFRRCSPLIVEHHGEERASEILRELQDDDVNIKLACELILSKIGYSDEEIYSVLEDK